MAKMKVGLIGLGRGGWRIAGTLLDSTWCDLVAVGSVDRTRVEAFTDAHPTITGYNDFRSLIVENPLDALFVATPPYQRSRYLPLAAERRIPVWMLSPAARTFEEAIEWSTLFEKADCPIVVSRGWGIEPELQGDAIGLEHLGDLFFAQGRITVHKQENLEWRGDMERAGGGVLLYRAYPLVDMLVQVMGLPATVFARSANISRPGTRFPYDTEDTAAMIGHYTDGAIAVVSGSWTTGPDHESLDIFGQEGSLCITPEALVVRDRASGQTRQELARTGDPLALQIEEFLRTLAAGAPWLNGTLQQHLSTVALIHTAYLSACTGQPESTRTLFEMHNIAPERRHPTRLRST